MYPLLLHKHLCLWVGQIGGVCACKGVGDLSLLNLLPESLLLPVPCKDPGPGIHNLAFLHNLSVQERAGHGATHIAPAGCWAELCAERAVRGGAYD